MVIWGEMAVMERDRVMVGWMGVAFLESSYQSWIGSWVGFGSDCSLIFKCSCTVAGWSFISSLSCKIISLNYSFFHYQ
jgi:hypothetical protein